MAPLPRPAAPSPAPAPVVSPLLTTVTEAIALAGDLIQVMEDERAALVTAGCDAPQGFAEAKVRLIAAYEIKLDELSQAGADALAEPAVAAAVDELRAINERLRAAAGQNAAALRGAMAANRMVLDLIADAARRQQPRSTGYGRTGAAAGNSHGRGDPMVLTRKL